MGAEKGDEFALAAVVERLGDKAEAVRIAAVQALLQIAEVGKRSNIAALGKSLTNDFQNPGSLSTHVLDALIQLAPVGDHSTITVVSRCLEHKCSNVRCAAVRALTLLTQKGDPNAVG